MFQRKSASKEILDSIEKMVYEGKKDLQIAELLKIPLPEIYRIRKIVLKISLYDCKKKCDKCGEEKSPVCFWSKAKHPDWCLLCRRKHDNEKEQKTPGIKLGRPFVNRNTNGFIVRKSKKLVKAFCLRCEKKFQSEIFIGFGGKEDHYRCCRHCRFIITRMEQVSI
jgi:hypothetical protein